MFFIFYSFCVHAQFADDFSDGDFSVNPEWTGNVDSFIVNEDKALRLNASDEASAYLVTESSLLSETEWRFRIRLDFSPSSQNYGRVYLISDSQNLTGPLNGYFLQFGERGSDDAVVLIKQTGTDETAVCRGKDGFINSSFDVFMKINRNKDGTWKLYSSPSIDGEYAFQAEGNDAAMNTGNYFGILCKYTKTRSAKFYFDDFYMGSKTIDSQAPVLERLIVDSDSSVSLYFNEEVSEINAQIPENYSINNEIAHPGQIRLNELDKAIVQLFFKTKLQDETEYELIIHNLEDNEGNKMGRTDTSFSFVRHDVSVFNDLVINEIFPDPNPSMGLPVHEFVEIYNRSDKSINLAGWTLDDEKEEKNNLNEYMLMPDSYLIVCSEAYLSEYQLYGDVMGIKSFPGLNNAGDHIYIYDGSMNIMDSMNYADDWYEDGKTLERIDPENTCGRLDNWLPSVSENGGTPGSQNSVFASNLDTIRPSLIKTLIKDSNTIVLMFQEEIHPLSANHLFNYAIANPGYEVNSIIVNAHEIELRLNMELNEKEAFEMSVTGIKDYCDNAMKDTNLRFTYYIPGTFDIVINEMLVDPTPSIELPEHEFIEIYNRSDYPVNIKDWAIVIGDAEKKLGSMAVNPKEFAIICHEDDAREFNNYGKVIPLASFPALTNSGQVVYLLDNHRNIIHFVSYSDQWYRDNYKKGGGWTLEQIDADNPCGGASNWMASEDLRGGTPGAQNAVFQPNPDTELPSLDRIVTLNDQRIKLLFNEPLDSVTTANPALYEADPHLGQPESVIPLSPMFNEVELAFKNRLRRNIMYRLLINRSVRDCAGNPLGGKNTGDFALPDTANPNDIIFNEILFDPISGGTEFVEIYNRSDKAIDLKNYVLAIIDLKENKLKSAVPIVNSSYLFFPEEYLVITEEPDLLAVQYAHSNPDRFLKIKDLPTLPNEEGRIILMDKWTHVIDDFTYSSDMHLANLNTADGISLERTNPDLAANDKNNWVSAAQTVGFATPGIQNAQFSEFIKKKTEISLSKEMFSPDQDGKDDVIYLDYRFDEPGYTCSVYVFDARGRMVKKLADNEIIGQEGRFQWDGLLSDNRIARIGVYTFYIRVYSDEGEVKEFKKSFVLAKKL